MAEGLVSHSLTSAFKMRHLSVQRQTHTGQQLRFRQHRAPAILHAGQRTATPGFPTPRKGGPNTAQHSDFTTPTTDML